MWNLTAWNVFCTLLSLIWPIFVLMIALYIVSMVIIIKTDHE